MENTTKTFPSEVTLDRIYSAYNGKQGCMCGCNGTYAYASKYKELASKDRGYIVSDDEVSDGKVKRRFNTIKNYKGNFIIGSNYVYIEGGDRCYAVYFK